MCACISTWVDETSDVALGCGSTDAKHARHGLFVPMDSAVLMSLSEYSFL